MPERERTKAEIEFIDRMTRSKMVDWAVVAAVNGRVIIQNAHHDPFVQHAVAKKWLSPEKNSGDLYSYKILSGGWDTAARFLKR
jgi:hypothetical protein